MTASTEIKNDSISFFIQSAIGIVVAMWPHEQSAQTSATAYAMAFMVSLALQFAAPAWFLFSIGYTTLRAERRGRCRCCVCVASIHGRWSMIAARKGSR